MIMDEDFDCAQIQDLEPLGNQENELGLKPIKSYTPSKELDGKELTNIVPDAWAWKELQYFPKDFAVHRIWIK